jgi:predicted DNA-binding transcriptional regulator AlpA
MLIPEVPIEERSISIPEFCALEGMSTTTYYSLKKDGLAPREKRLPGRNWVRITPAARRGWHVLMEKKSKEKAEVLERERRVEQSKIAGKKAGASPKHICRRRRTKKMAKWGNDMRLSYAKRKKEEE